MPDGRPLPLPVITVGSGEGMAAVVKSYDAETGALNFERPVFDPAFTGGVRVATADFSGDGFPDVVVAAGPGGGPNVKVLDGKTGDPIPGPLGSFFAYDPEFAGGVEVAAADVDGDGFPDLITGAGVGGAAHVQVFGGRDGSRLASYLSFDLAFRGGVSVAAADFTGDGKAEIVTGAGPGGGPHVKVLDALTGEVVPGPLGSFFAFDADAPGGVAVAADWKAGDVDADGVPDLAVGTGPGAASRVRVFSGATGAVLRDLAPFDPAFTGGVSLGLAYVSDDPEADIVVGTGPGAAAAVRVFSGATGELLAPPQGEYAPFGSGFSGGVRVAASNDPVYLTVTRVAHAVEPTTNGGTFTPGVFRISVAGTRTTSFTASFSLTGTAVGGTDYTTPPTTITVTPSQNTYDVTIAPRYDTLSEGAEQLRLSLSGGSGYEVTAPGSADMWVLDPGASPPPPTGAIGDYAWYDVNGNGVMDGAETHATKVTVALSGGPTAKDATETNTYGQYGFTGLDDGTYTVTFSKSGYSFSTPAGGKATVVVSGGVGGSANAGLVLNGSVGDFVWEDLNRDGDQDAGEPGVSGAVVDLYPLPSGAPLQRTTGADGKFSFAGIPPGRYVARVQLPAGFQFTAPWVSTGGATPADGLTPSGTDSEVDPIYAWSGSFTVAQGQAELGLDAGAYRPPAGTGTAFGTVWDDANGDGLQAGETGLAGVRVDIYDAAGTTYLGWATTGPRGGYTFPGLGAGTYTLRVRAPYALSPKDVGANDAIDSDFDPASGAVAFTISSGQAVFRDAGVKRPPAAPVVGDRAWVDTDRDGVQDPDEPGLPNVLVRLRNASLQVVGEVLTDAGGWYSFSGAGRTGLHQIVFIAPSGYQLTHAGAGSDPAKDSDADPVTSCTDWFTFTSGQAQLDFDAGMVATAGTGAIVGTVWDDLYATYGLRTTGGGNYEPGLPGVTVELLNPTGTPVLDAAGQPRAARTGAHGGYVFPGLSTSNSYKVRIQPPRSLVEPNYGENTHDGLDSDFDWTSLTTAVLSVFAGTLVTADAGVARVSMDLDVNNDGALSTPGVDWVSNYLPGYAGDVPVLTPTAVQKMNVIAWQLQPNTTYKFSLKPLSTTALPGIAGNAMSDPSAYPSSAVYDYDFVLFDTANGRTVGDFDQPVSVTSTPQGKVVVPLWARDFGGKTTVVLSDSNGNTIREMKVPRDFDNDELPDVWERAKVREWNAQYGQNKPVDEDFFTANDDKEELDPDGAGPLVAHKTAGDHIPTSVEYRGFFLNTTNEFTYAHARLSPARKEGLLEVDHQPSSTLTGLPPGGLADYFTGADQVLSHPTRGAGIRLYWYADDHYLSAPAAFNPLHMQPTIDANMNAHLEGHRGAGSSYPSWFNDALNRYFTHYMMFDNVPDNYRRDSMGLTYDRSDQPKNGTYVFTSAVAQGASDLNISRRDMAAVVIAHEFTHMVIMPVREVVPWDKGEHDVLDLDGVSLMGGESFAANRSIGSVVIKQTTQREYNLKENPSLL